MSTSKPNAAEKARAAQLATLVSAVWTGITARDAAIAAYKAAGFEDETTKAYIMRTYVARKLNPNAAECTAAMLTEARRVLALPGVNAKVVEKRDADQERICGAARVFLLGIRKAAGVTASDTRGGANNTTGNGMTAPKASNPVANIPTSPAGPPSSREPKFETGVELRAHFFQQAKVFGMMIEKYNDICDPVTRKVITKFVKDTADWAPKADA